jgi:metal-responsive CopG/Arc/MetJ family transcriptional regulator
MQTAISLPDPIFEAAESLAQQMGVSRNELYTKALQAYLKKHSPAEILQQLNRIYTTQSSELDPALAQMQFLSLPSEESPIQS